MKRLVDIVASLLGILLASPIIVPVLFLVWVQDWNSPFYIAPRVGKDGKLFSMIKLRSMVNRSQRHENHTRWSFHTTLQA
jgi:lipopolysaccharide/colanic/teichoic acid biosynthesis glycosyltransferase